jgi:hypothetical protein
LADGISEFLHVESVTCKMQSLEEKCELEHKLANAMSQLAERATGPAEADTIIRHLRHELSQCVSFVDHLHTQVVEV